MMNTLDACLNDLFSQDDDIRKRYPAAIAERLFRIRAIYNWLMEKPELKDRQIVEADINNFGIGKSAAYDDLAVIKAILPNFAANTKAWHRWRFNTLILETYQLAKARKDTKTMEKALATYAKYNAIDIDDERELPYEQIVVQPFIPTQDPSVLGIKPMPNRRQRIKELIQKYAQDSQDILDVQYEEADLPELNNK